MASKEAPTRATEGKSARKALAAIYGKAEVSAQAERYARLEALMPAEGAPAGEPRFYSAPGRTELGGNHTDHNRGRVLCAAVDLDAVACVRPRADLAARVLSEGYPDPIEVDLGDLRPRPEERGRSAALVRGVASGLARRGIGPRGFSARIHSTVLAGSGLSSSAAIEVLLGTAMADLAGASIDPLEIARIGQEAENEFFGKPCGLMDQAASAMGGIVAIDFEDPGEPAARRLDFDFEAAGLALVVVATGGSHADLTADYAAIPAEMRSVAAFLGAETLREADPAAIEARGPEIRRACGDRALLRAMHFVGENERVRAMVAALRSGDLGAYLKLVKRSGDSSWRLLQNVSPPGDPRRQGLGLALALSERLIGKSGAWRVHGGGFAGTIQAYLPRKLLGRYVDIMESYFGPGCVLRIRLGRPGALRVL